MALIPLPEPVDVSHKVLYRSNADIESPYGIYPAGNLFRIVFQSPDETYSQVEDAEPDYGAFPHQMYIETKLLEADPSAVAPVPAPLPVMEVPDVRWTDEIPTVNAAPEASTAIVAAVTVEGPVEAPEAIVEPVEDAPAPKKRVTRKPKSTS